MAVIDALREVVGQQHAGHVLGAAVLVGLLALIVDYAMMLNLRRKMVCFDDPDACGRPS
jgi:hypothetical protein